MTDYKKLVEALRCCIPNPPEKCVGCTYNIGNNECAVRRMMLDAAAAIEALQAELGRKRTADCWGCKCEKIEPKRGEWKTTDAFPHRVYCSNCFRTYVPNDRWQIWVDKPGEGGLERDYCPACGAKMEVQE